MARDGESSDAMSPVDFGRTATDYGQHRPGFPDKLYLRLERLGVRFDGKRTLDLGTGTGAMSRELARRGARVVGLDPARELLLEARRLDSRARLDVRYVRGRAERVGAASASLDLVTAGQCWWWFEGDRALAEVRRVLDVGGLFVRASFDWLPRPGNVVEATEALISHYNPSWPMGGRDGLHTEWIRDLSSAGFEDIESFSFDVGEPFSHEDWRGRVRASAGVGASLDPASVAAFDADLRVVLATQFPSDPLEVDHRVFAVIGRRAGY